MEQPGVLVGPITALFRKSAGGKMGHPKVGGSNPPLAIQKY